MKIIDLLKTLIDNNAPKKIKIFDGTTFVYNEPNRHYYTTDKKSLLEVLDKYRGDVFNMKVEIIEEEKKIPEKLEILSDNEHYSNEVLYGKINEIIDYLKSKGDDK